MALTSITTLKVGAKAPSFKALDQDGRPFDSKEMLGKTWVLFFYPNDMTATCTIEVCDLRDHYKKLKQAGLEIVGVSRGDVASKKKFSSRNKLPFPLLADEDLKISGKYKVFGDKPFMGKILESIYRTTFLIGSDGKILHIIKQVKAKEASAQILEAVRSL
ncbi:MAG: peroxiredoxin [Chitinophagales bacterium]|nr:peroxiredoxin [Chitinophagales bacterium]HAE12639.1 peroxiredoxin [Bacteroidota bacterium]MCB9021245.1 peroxiredoxin [Chitinophagales bacterium]HAE36071.1 peroxiredoxin [Bacteroidota bacterium]HPE96942.1 peroxiredoxin [Chitinophagales bacterium]